MQLGQTIPALPVSDADKAVPFYSERLGFRAVHHDGGFAVMARDEAVLHLWQADDTTWQQRSSWDRPIQSGAESFLAGTASCRIQVDDVDLLYDELRGQGVLHRVSQGGVTATDFGSREFSALDLDGNLLTFFAWVEE